MAGVDVIADVGDTLVALLVNGLGGVVAPDHVKVSTPDDFQANPTQPTVTVFLYQVAINPEMRNSPPRTVMVERPSDHRLEVKTTRPLLPLDLHYLVTAWAKEPKDEYRISGRVLQTFYDHAELGPADLQGDSWRAGDSVQVIYEQLSLEQQFNIWNPTHLPYRLSLSYLVRVVGIEPSETKSDAPVISAGFRRPR
jgi:hypothetical protein